MPSTCSRPLLALALTATPALAQWTVVTQVPSDVARLPEFVRPDTGAVARIDWTALQAILQAAPTEGDSAPAMPIVLPMPDGSMANFTVVNAPTMEPGLAAKFPQFQTYRVRGVTDPAATGCIDVTSQGLRAMIRTSTGTVFIDPFSARQRDYVSVYDLSQYSKSRNGDWNCGVAPNAGVDPEFDPEHGLSLQNAAAPLGPGNPLRQYRMALACTGEFGAFHSDLQGHAPNQTDALAAVITMNNRASALFEVDVGVRFVLVANNDLLAFYDPATDPYPNADPNCTIDPAADCSSPYLNINTSVINGIIGSANYDIGHVMTRVRGGVAYLSSVCTNNKGGGVSGIPRGGELDPLAATVVMHEVGHQFGATHTFNGVLGRCGGNITGSSAWEPGGGSTLLAYPGACPVGGPYGTGTTDNLVQYADVYFHSGSLLQMRTFLNSTTSQCSTNVATTNLLPSVLSITPTLLTVPANTPFALTVQISDDSPTPLFCWDELDTGPAQSLVGGAAIDNGLSPLFRSFYPTTSPTRVFPRWADILSASPSLGEQMPSAAGSVRKFRVSVRDQQGGSITSSIVRVNIGATGPFRVTQPTQFMRFSPGSTATVAWDVAGTNAAPYTAATVRMYLSLTDDQQFTTLLGEFPNTGTAQVVFPTSAETQTARLKIEPTNGQIFFAVSPSFLIQYPCDSIDFNRDGLFPDTADIDDFLLVFSGGQCSNHPHCGDIDWNNDGLFPDTQDINDYLNIFSGGTCF
ncbi:MAG: M12 family metallo-peptidase [Phycisphaerales bacterium]